MRSITVAVALLVALAWPSVLWAHDDTVVGPPDVTITIDPGGLSDREVRLSAGSIVRFVNRDDERHRMRARSGPVEFDTGNLDPGESFQVRVPRVGTYAYADERDRDDVAFHGRFVVGERTSGGGVTSGSGATSDGGETPNGGATVADATATVTIGDDFFDPGTVRVAIDATVTFRNTGQDDHSATGDAFDTGVLPGGSSASATFPSAGTFDFLCVFHSDMRGTIEVVAPDAATPAAEGVAAPAVADPGSTASPASPDAPADGDPAPAASTSIGGLAGLVVAITSVAVAVALFARVLRGTVRPRISR